MYDDKRIVKFLETIRTLVKEAKAEFPTYEFELVPAPGYGYLELNITTDPDYAYHNKYGDLVPNENRAYSRLISLLEDDPRMKDLGFKTHPMLYKPNKLTIEYFVFN